MRRATLEVNYEDSWKNREKDGSFVVFIEGKSCVPPPPKNVKPFQVMMSKPPEFLDLDKMKVEVIGEEGNAKVSKLYFNTE